MVDPKIRGVVAKFIEVLIKKGIRVDRVILYGSFATGKIHEGSDIDIAVVSPDFGKDRFEEGKMLFQSAWRIDPRIEPVPISSESYKNDTWVPLIYEIRQKGIELKVA
ncbi:MAG: nucleotidyltransferase domain-containing protein [Elusimicrobia bacterium]|nr:nucleotidyltransferase domain-containing protein [Elusimicrobiota bacterium]